MMLIEQYIFLLYIIKIYRVHFFTVFKDSSKITFAPTDHSFHAIDEKNYDFDTFLAYFPNTLMNKTLTYSTVYCAQIK